MFNIISASTCRSWSKIFKTIFSRRWGIITKRKISEFIFSTVTPFQTSRHSIDKKIKESFTNECRNINYEHNYENLVKQPAATILKMCILFLHVDPNPAEGQFRFITATNRDESYVRPAFPASKNDETNIIGGLDMEKGREGGMWLGFTSKQQRNGEGTTHCFSALLNLSGESTENACGRGSIVKEYLETPDVFPQYVKRLEEKTFNGYNLVGVELSENNLKTYHHSNNPKIDCVYSGKHTLGFGNNAPYNPSQKVLRGRGKFIGIIEKNLDADSLEEELIKLLKDTTRNLPDLELQKRYPKDYEPLSSIFVEMGRKGYGTRTHTVILIDKNWNLNFIEYTMVEPIDIHNPKWNITRINHRL